MDKTRDVAVIVGSLRKDSINRKVANALAELAPVALKLSMVDIGQLPIYNQDGDEIRRRYGRNFASGSRLLTLFFSSRLSIIDRSLLPLKNAIDVGSRPYGKSAWSGKPGAVVSASPGGIGGFGANHHLRQSLVFLNVPAMAQPEAYSAAPTSCSTPTASSSMTERANFWRASCRIMRMDRREQQMIATKISKQREGEA